MFVSGERRAAICAENHCGFGKKDGLEIKSIVRDGEVITAVTTRTIENKELVTRL
jgi:hypothetical protein